MEFVKSWKLPTPTKLADKLKSALQGEMANAEWELLEEKEWDEGLDFGPPTTSAATTTTTSTPTEEPSNGTEIKGRGESATTAGAPEDVKAETRINS
jgi:hypothetical protein